MEVSDMDPPPNNYYNPENPLESDDEIDPKADPFSVAASMTDRTWEDDTGSDKESDACIPSNPAPEPKVFTDLFCVKTYSKEDLYPTELDPGCYPAWTLSAYWPVYVSNFRLNSLEETERNTQIATYFASKGLLSRMIFIRENDDQYFRSNQKKTLLLDMLVYFTCQEDADRAIRCCDQTTYYGHKLNAQPGRVPVWFDPERSVCFKMTKRSIHHTESFVEHILRNQGLENIGTTLKISDCELILEFSDLQSMYVAVAHTKKWIPSRLTGPVRKQRYLEQDCKYEMMFLITENPSFLEMLPPDYMLQDLLSGKLPPVVRDWDNWTSPKPIPQNLQETLTNHRLKRKNQLIENHRARQEAKRKGLEVERKGPTGFIKKHKQEVVRQKEVFFGVPPKVYWFDHNNSERAEWAKRKCRRLTEELNATREKLLSELELARKLWMQSLAVRNKLFYDLLQLERELRKHIAKNDGLETDTLDNGLNVAIIIAGEQRNFPNYPTDVALSDYQEPLDTMWPVFLGNFPVTSLEPKQRNQEVCDFFAAKGFAVRMIYLNENGKFYNSYLKIVKLLDMLVYFDSREVATKVIDTYRGTIHRGSILGVFPGRWIICFHDKSTLYLKLDKDPIVAEQSIDRVLINLAPDAIHSFTRFPKRAYFGFAKSKPKAKAFYAGLSLNYPTKRRTKQRYIEKDVKQELLRRLLNDADFLNSQPKPDALRKLFVAESVPSEEGGEIVWVGDYQKRKQMNERIGAVLAEWEKLQ